MNKEKNTYFNITITPSVTVEEIIDMPFFGKNYDLESSINPTWFKQIKVLDQHTFLDGKQTSYTIFSLDFTIKDTIKDIHDRFLPDLLCVLEDLGNKTNKKFTVNTGDLTFWYGDKYEHFCSCKVVNNKLIIIDSNSNATNTQEVQSVTYKPIKSNKDDPLDIINKTNTNRIVNMETEENTKLIQPPERKYKKIKLDYDDFTRC